MRHVGEAGDDDQRRQGVEVPRDDADQALDPGGDDADGAHGHDVTEGEDDRRAEDRHQQQRLQPSAAGHVGANHDEGEHGADRHGDHRHAEGHRQRRCEGAPEVGILDDKLVSLEGELRRGREERVAQEALVDDQEQGRQDEDGGDRDRRRAQYGRADAGACGCGSRERRSGHACHAYLRLSRLSSRPATPSGRRAAAAA